MFRSWCYGQGPCGPGVLHVVSLSACYPTTLCASTLTLSFSMLLGARTVWTRCSSCTFIVRLLSYRPLRLHSYSKFLSCCWGQGLCEPSVLHVLSLFAGFPTTLSSLYSYYKLFHVARGKACVDQFVSMYFYCPPSFLPSSACLLLRKGCPCCLGRYPCGHNYVLS